MKILIISLAGIGDTILATPLIRELRAGYPDARIDAFVLWSGSRDVLQGNPHINAVYQRNLLKQPKMEALRFLLPLHAQGYDISINTHPQSRTHYRLIARIVGAKTRISHTYESFGFVDHFLVNRTLPQDYEKHSVENNLELLRILNKQTSAPNHFLELFLSPSDNEWAAKFLAAHRIENRRVLGIHSGSGGTKNLALKRWPLENYIQLLQLLKVSSPDISVLLFGGADEEAELERVIRETGWSNVIRARTGTLQQAGALMRRCSAVLSVDTALMHVGAAVQAPHQVVIEAPTLNKTNLPYKNPYRLVPNPALNGRNLDFYRYDGLGIKGSAEELTRLMASVTVDSVHSVVREELGLK